MTAQSDRSDRDPEDDAAARRWAERARRKGEAGALTDDADYLAQKVTEEKRKLERP